MIWSWAKSGASNGTTGILYSCSLRCFKAIIDGSMLSRNPLCFLYNCRYLTPAVSVAGLVASTFGTDGEALDGT